MNVMLVIEVLKKYSECPECGEDVIMSNCQIEDDKAWFSCDCGWGIIIKEKKQRS